MCDCCVLILLSILLHCAMAEFYNKCNNRCKMATYHFMKYHSKRMSLGRVQNWNKKKIKLRFSGIEKWVIEWITTIIVTYSKARLYCVSCWVKPVSQNVASRKEVASLTQTNRLTSQFYCFSSGSVKFHTTSLTTLVIMTSETNYFSSLGKHNSTFG